MEKRTASASTHDGRDGARGLTGGQPCREFGISRKITRIDRSLPPVESVGVQWADNESFALRLGLLQKDDIGIDVASQNTKTAAIRRPVERKDLLSVEVSNLTPGRTVHWLNPDVVHAILANAVSDCLSICCKLRRCGDSRIYIQ